GAAALARALPAALDSAEREAFERLAERLAQGGAPAALAARAASMGSLSAALDAVEIAAASRGTIEDAIDAYFRTGTHFSLQWLRERILELPRATRWQVLARAALRDDVSLLQRELTAQVLQGAREAEEFAPAIERWCAAHEGAVARYMEMLADIRASRTYDLTTLPVALREGRNLLR